ncbi:MAG: hypothetical protein ACTHL1_06770 [Burkholderiaceae bacterium]
MGNVLSRSAPRLAVLCAALALSSAALAARLGHPDPFSPQPLQPGQPQPQPFVNRNPLPDITFGARPPVVEPPLPANRVPPSIYYDNPYYQPPQPAFRQREWEERRWRERREQEERWRQRQGRAQQGWDGQRRDDDNWSSW